MPIFKPEPANSQRPWEPSALEEEHAPLIVGSMQLDTGLHTFSERTILLDAAKLCGSGEGATWLRSLGHRGTVDAPDCCIAAENLEQCLAESPRARWQSNVNAKQRPRYLAEIRDLSLHGGQEVNDKPAKWDAALPILCHGVGLYDGGQRLRNVQISNCHGYGVVVDGGSDNRSGEQLPVDREEVQLENLYVQKCFGGVWLRSGADNVVQNLIVASCRDHLLRISSGSMLVSNCHLYGGNVGMLLDGSGRTYFSGHTQIETCWEWGLRNISNASASFQDLRMHGCGPDATRSTRTFCGGIDLQIATTIGQLDYTHATDAGYAIQSTGNGTSVRGLIAGGHQGARCVYHQAANCQYDLTIGGSAIGVGFVFAGGDKNEIRLRSHLKQPTLRIHDAGRNNRFVLTGGLAEIASDEKDFMQRGNSLDARGSVVKWAATLAPPTPLK